MGTRVIILLLLLFSVAARAQDPVSDTIKRGIENDSIAFDLLMDEVVISNVKDTVSPEMKKQLMILKRRVYKVYPFAKIAAERLTMLNANMAKLKTEKEKRKYSKIVEKYLENEFEAQLKKLSRKEGQVLIKLIYRQTGRTTFELIKEYKSGWKAFWSSRIAKMFDLDLKSKYSPGTVAEDYYIEGFLRQGFAERRLVKQDPAFTIDYDALTEQWLGKIKK
ncbi:hypothetical protein CHU92_08135 [Flavobacterium cyanobacteriorum]|uniref:DUF4294 domain-containing protein n=1 Tax=Flavobacterium cyanobacteriorum TaxID=2022802 RepID=A0A255Z7U9_9FLAO|nr:DUF4294 domain-containing protein [Flavobacterium cyanobacteriorum]OYQ37548.1 hypothetical protein CHU92_08135 [Flavobacterium cyanobacteriorum]